ncbi:MAG: hypothetical protein RBR71_12705 [Gudongella sp.]|nr:hypothetical protein [Gudongella sp.]
MKKWLQKIMMGRYGVDKLSNAMIMFALAFILASILTKYTILNTIGLVIIIIAYFRIFSRDIPKRYKENQKFLAWFNPIKGKFNKLKNKLRNSKDYKYFKCPQCGKEMRVPRKKGRVNIKCPNCGNSFTRRT